MTVTIHRDTLPANAESSGYAAVVGRVLMSIIFLVSGYMKVMHFGYMAGYLASKGAPAPRLLLGLAAAAELVGGLSLLLGLWARLGAAGLFVFLIPTTLMFHNFWAMSPGSEAYTDQQAHFMKNLAIMGGLLIIVAFGPGPLSITPTWRRRMAESTM